MALSILHFRMQDTKTAFLYTVMNYSLKDFNLGLKLPYDNFLGNVSTVITVHCCRCC